MGTDVQVCAASMEAMRAEVKKGTYHNAMAMSQSLPALQQQSYLSLKGKECRSEDGRKCCLMDSSILGAGEWGGVGV